MRGKSFREKNSILYEEIKSLDDGVGRLSTAISQRQEKISYKADLLDEKRLGVFEDVDRHFDQIFERLCERREQLKADYDALELKERKRLQ